MSSGLIQVGGRLSCLSPQVVPLDARPIHYPQPRDSAEEDDREGDSDYVVGFGSSNETSSSDEYVLETPIGGGARFLMHPYLPISQLSKVSSHYHTLNLNAMQLDDLFNASQEEDYNTNNGLEFQIGHRFRNCNVVLMAVKDYSMRKNAEYKILESDRLKYHCRCKQFTNGCPWSLRVALHQNLNY
ncbi:uncharacterized protein [Arachis hypogaea]|uniref:uncharacterized protein n=1 Tax=Arachis hypogaea TaxID=3818 RepID=UPI003B215549